MAKTCQWKYNRFVAFVDLAILAIIIVFIEIYSKKQFHNARTGKTSRCRIVVPSPGVRAYFSTSVVVENVLFFKIRLYTVTQRLHELLFKTALLFSFCDRLLSVDLACVRCHFSFKWLLLLNCLVKVNKTCQVCFLYEVLRKISKDFNSMQKSGFFGNQKETI